MNNISVIFLLLRRMRLPLLVLIVSYAVSILGLTLIDGVDPAGRPASPMSFFHAFYVISYTATTIGFGELPYAFSEAQRAWIVFSIYLTVIAWLYGIGNILTLIQDPGIRREVKASRFHRKVRRLRVPFYLICGCGETGGLLLKALDSHNRQAVVLDIKPERISELELGEYHMDTPALDADARLPEVLIAAGLENRHCAAVIALTDDDQANLTVATTAKLLRPNLPVLCRSDTLEVAANMASFETDEVINPFELFGDHLAMALSSPGQYLLYEWLTGVPGSPLIQPLRPPRGKWVVCGYGRFGKAVVRNLRKEGIALVVVEAEPEKTGCMDCIRGSGTEARTLVEAGIEDAVGIVAGTDHDINNLSIAMTARQLNPNLFVVARQNRQAHGALFARFNAHITMQPSHIIAHEFLSLLTTPLLARFLTLTRTRSNDWANELISRIIAVVNENVPELWDVRISKRESMAVTQMLEEGRRVTLSEMLRHPSNRENRLACVPLLLRRGKQDFLLPDEDYSVQIGDRVLFCAQHGIRKHMTLLMQDIHILTYLMTGRDVPGGTIWRWLEHHNQTKLPHS